jgi:hypothetical protein
MIESVLIIFAGIFLIWIVRESRKKHAEVAKLSSKERDELKQNVNLSPKKYFMVGGSFTEVPIWVVVLVVAILAGALVLGVKSIT